MFPVVGGQLLRRGRKGCLTYRFIPPLWMRDKFGNRRQIWIALHTQDLDVAQERAVRIWLRLHEMSKDPSLYGLGVMLFSNGDLEITDAKPEEAEAVNRILDRHREAILKSSNSAPSSEGQPVDAVSQTSPTVEKCSEAYRKYRHERIEIAKAWKPATINGNDAAIALLQEIVGDLPMSCYDDKTLRRFCEILALLPPHRTTSSRWRSLSLEEIMRRAPGGQSRSNINKNLQFVAGFFDWYVSRHPDILDKHNLRANLIRAGRDRPRDHEQRKSLTDAQVEAYCKAPKAKTALQFWLIPLGAYTGARVGELAQLRLNDIQKIDGVWCLHVREGQGQSIKTRASARTIPIHPALIQAGFLRFVEERRRLPQQEDWLWWEEAGVQDKPDAASKWANRVRHGKGYAAAGIDGPGYSFHSLRHTVATKLAEAGVREAYLADLLGHEREGTESSKRYVKTTVKLLDKSIRKLEYPFVLPVWPGIKCFTVEV